MSAAGAESRALAVGVTGHRILAEPEKVEAGVDVALTRFEAAFPRRPLIVVSALAEGADRLVARRILKRPGARLLALLPLPRSDYIADFGSAASKQEFQALLEQAVEIVEPKAAVPREQAYDAVGDAVLDRCEVLLTIWDGLGAQGRGGTGAVVARAKQRQLPIAWVHAGNRKPGTLEPTTLGAEQGRVTFENW